MPYWFHNFQYPALPGEKWHIHRKMITPTFHFKILESFVEVFAEKSEILISKLQKEVGSKGFDVCPYITKCTLDIICGERMRRHFHEAVYPITFSSSEECIQTC